MRIYFNDKNAYIFQELSKNSNVNLYLDLICGLPGETLSGFLESFDFVMSYDPGICQIELLKILSGTEIRKIAQQKNFEYHKEPPYKILKTDKMDYSELRHVEHIRTLVDKLYNKEWLKLTFYYLNKYFYNSYAKLFSDLVEFWKNRNLFAGKFSVKTTFKNFSDFLSSKIPEQHPLWDIFVLETAKQGQAFADEFSRNLALDINIIKDKNRLKEILKNDFNDIYYQKIHKYCRLYNLNLSLEELQERRFPLSPRRTKILFLYALPIANEKAEMVKLFKIENYPKEQE